MVENGGNNYTKSASPVDNLLLSNGTAHKNGDAARIDMSDVAYTSPTPGQKCFGEKSDVERVLDSRCPCLQYKCLHLSGTLLVTFLIGSTLIICFRHYVKDFLEWLEHIDGWISGLIFIIMFTIVSFPMTWGYIVLNVAAGYLYGFLVGMFTVTVAVIIGVATSLVVCRIFINDFVHSKLQSEHLKAIIRVVESRRGFKVVFLTRLTPIPFGLQNGLFAITSISIPRCLAASFIGLLPTQALNAYMGSSLRTMEDVVHHNSAGGYFLLAFQVGISAFLMWYVIRRARYELNKACLPTTDYDVTYKQLSEQRSLHLFGKIVGGGGGGDSEAAKVASPTNSYEEEPIAEQTKKQGHKRAKSAGAVMYAFEKAKENV